MIELFSILGIFLAVEGAFYAAAPSMARKMAYAVSQMEEAELRRAGLFALCAGVVLVWLVRG